MSLPVAAPAPAGRWKTISLRFLELALALWLVSDGLAKLYGAGQSVQIFDIIGAGQWFRVVTGLLELTAAGLLVTRGMAAFGAILAAAIMIGATSANLLVLDHDALHALVPALIFLILAWIKRGELFSAFTHA
ncbi:MULTISPECIES: DoxX family protein [unclassified Beijerinckia]|uniref:DoxX family protein n=1 Tax=unclassified Beijerinckia TaxID=2638183 RepID=UPI00089999BB|nr:MULTISPECIES: DoxX family protein [unclassified Beijerinckia]MDH7794078.1 putative oxidoreductase [Beijerinckia sp. GAS462]SEB52829.1 DoxX-like family protein [Beijerinckia sp. 28-YEA-48]